MRALVLLGIAFACAACVDKAKSDWDRCVERDKAYDVAGAYSACAAAVAADPKSPSGQSAQQKLNELAPMMDKIKSEQANKASRDDAIKRASELDAATTAQLLSSATATVAVAAPPSSSAGDPAAIFTKARALSMAGNQKGARALLEPRVSSGVASPDEIGLLIGICKGMHDRACIAKYKSLYAP